MDTILMGQLIHSDERLCRIKGTWTPDKAREHAKVAEGQGSGEHQK